MTALAPVPTVGRTAWRYTSPVMRVVECPARSARSSRCTPAADSKRHGRVTQFGRVPVAEPDRRSQPGEGSAQIGWVHHGAHLSGRLRHHQMSCSRRCGRHSMGRLGRPMGCQRSHQPALQFPLGPNSPSRRPDQRPMPGRRSLGPPRRHPRSPSQDGDSCWARCHHLGRARLDHPGPRLPRHHYAALQGIGPLPRQLEAPLTP